MFIGFAPLKNSSVRVAPGMTSLPLRSTPSYKGLQLSHEIYVQSFKLPYYVESER